MKRKSASFLGVLLAAVICFAVPACNPDAGGGNEGGNDDGQKKQVDVVLFTGQSNMVGRETSKYSVSIEEGKAFEYKFLSDSLVPVANPVGETFGSVEVSSGSSIVPQFCADYVSSTGRNIVAVHVARGGRAISYFTQQGAIYADIVRKYSACIDYLENSDGYEVGRRFYVMFQGESDTNSTASQDYYDSYMSFHNGLKDAIGTEFGAQIYIGRNSTEDKAGILRINNVKKQLAEDNEDIIICNKENATYYYDNPQYLLSDNIHYTASGLKKIATDSCRSIVDFMGLGTDKSKTGIDPVSYLAEPDPDLFYEPPVYEVENGVLEFGFADGGVQEAEGRITATKSGRGVPTIADGAYEYSNPSANTNYAADNANDFVTYELSHKILLSAASDWAFEWKGYCNDTMNRKAAILASGGETVFITYQAANGIYIRNGNSKVECTGQLAEMYNEHVWKLVYTASENALRLFMDGAYVASSTWNDDLVFTDLLGCSAGMYQFVGKLYYLRFEFGTAVVSPEIETVTQTTYEFNFDGGEVAEANGLIGVTKVGDGAPTIADGRYEYTDAVTPLRYELSEAITLSSTADWSFEWKGYAATTMNNKAAILISGGDTAFITFQSTNGLYIKSGTKNIPCKSQVSYIYEEHTWKFAYNSETHMLAIYRDGEYLAEAAWSSDLVITDILGCSVDKYTFCGSLDYIKITIG